MTDEFYHNEIQRAEKTLRRAGRIMEKIIEQIHAEGRQIATAEEAMIIRNSYGLNILPLVILLASHNIKIDKEAFIKALIKQNDMLENAIRC